MERDLVHEKLQLDGMNLRSVLNKIIGDYGLEEYISLYGPYELNRIKFKNNGIQTLFIQEMAKNGVLIIGSHNLSSVHKQTEFLRIISGWHEALKKIKEAVSSDILEHLDGGLVTAKGVR